MDDGWVGWGWIVEGWKFFFETGMALLLFGVVGLLCCGAGGWIVDLVLGVMLMIEVLRIRCRWSRCILRC